MCRGGHRSENGLIYHPVPCVSVSESTVSVSETGIILGTCRVFLSGHLPDMAAHISGHAEISVWKESIH